MMRFSVRLVLCSILLLCFPLLAAAGDDELPPILSLEERKRVLIGTKSEKPEPRQPTFNETRALASQDDFDVTHYLVDLDFDEQQETVSGSVKVTATSLVDGLQTVSLNLLNNMNVTIVTRGLFSVPFTHGGNILDITLDQSFDTGQSFQIRVYYNGSPQGGSGFGAFGWNKYYSSGQGEMVWSLSEPEGSRNWWPCKDRPDDKALVEEWWTVRDDWIATGNGVLQGVDTMPGSKKRYRWVATNPLTTYLVSIAASDYVQFSHTYTPIAGGSMPVDYYVYPEDLSNAQTSFSETVTMLEYYAQEFGEYPFVDDKYGMSSFPFGGAMEHSTNTSYGYWLINGGHTYDYIIAHEAAHQWWGDSVSPETWLDIWLNEGFASYSEALWAEHLGGASNYRSYMDSMRESSFAGPLYDPDELFGTTVYHKGAWVVHMLRWVMGDTAFFQGLRDWYTNHMDSTGNTAQLQAEMELLYGGSLEWFFQEWVYLENRPKYQFGYTTADLGATGDYRNYIQISQTQTNAGLFTMPVELKLVTASGSEHHTVWNNAQDQVFVLDSVEPLTAVVVDEFEWILKGTTTQTTLTDTDADGVPDSNDNCPLVANGAQLDFDGDLIGDACDDDDDDDDLLDVDDCAPLDPDQGTPGNVDLLLLEATPGAPSTLTWTAAPRADAYDISRGLVAELESDYGSCFAPMVPDLFYIESDEPSSGAGYQYLVRGHDSGCGGPGSMGTDSAGAPRPSPCP